MICPVCGHENLSGALVCAQCFTLLKDVPINPQETTLPEPAPDLTTQGVGRQRFVDLHGLSSEVALLYFEGLADPVVVKISQQALIGRRTLNTAIQPGIDLTLYGGFDKGISRIHAVIRRVDDGLTIEDLGSTNGTWLNGEKLTPYNAALLRSGDRLIMGQLSMEIYFRG